MDNTAFRLDISITNLDEVQATEILRMLWLMQHLGHIGASRWLAFYADGDGAFKPNISVNKVSILALDNQNLTDDWEDWKRGSPEAFLFDPD